MHNIHTQCLSIKDRNTTVLCAHLHKFMQFDPENKIVKLCAKGMELEIHQPEEAEKLFLQAWNTATNDFEKLTAAHYVARHQPSIEQKLNWDKTALEFALKLNEDSMLATYPSLYLNIARCYEDLKDIDQAHQHYQSALSYAANLPDDGYGRMIRSGIKNGLNRTLQNKSM